MYTRLNMSRLVADCVWCVVAGEEGVMSGGTAWEPLKGLGLAWRQRDCVFVCVCGWGGGGGRAR
jgi:hypothetical protein